MTRMGFFSPRDRSEALRNPPPSWGFSIDKEKGVANATPYRFRMLRKRMLS